MQSDDAKEPDVQTPPPGKNAGQSSTDPAEGSDDTPAPTKDSPQG
jgi:hypothetical protein